MFWKAVGVIFSRVIDLPLENLFEGSANPVNAQCAERERKTGE